VPSYRGDMEAIATMTGRLDRAAEEAGRDPAELRRVLNVMGTITDGTSEGSLNGPVDLWVEELGELATTHRFDTFIFGNDEPEQLERFALEVVPALRADIG